MKYLAYIILTAWLWCCFYLVFAIGAQRGAHSMRALIRDAAKIQWTCEGEHCPVMGYSGNRYLRGKIISQASGNEPNPIETEEP